MKPTFHPKYKYRMRTDAGLREIEAHGTPLFPCAQYEGKLSDYFTGEIPWHWHEEVEFFLVTEGRARVLLDRSLLVLEAGEGVFFNANALHTIRQAGDSPCYFRSLIFDPSLVGGRPEGAIDQRYVRPLVSCTALRHIAFKPQVSWQAVCLGHFQAALHAYARGGFGFEFGVRDSLSRLWQCMVENMQDELIFYAGDEGGQAGRLKAMLDYIHEHAHVHIALPDIAAAANISERECCRCFERTIGMSPMAYVLDYRICAAAVLLEESDLTVTLVSERTGFNSPSYFSKVFRRRMGCSPREYREKRRTIC